MTDPIPTTIYENNQVCAILLDNTVKIHVKPGTYKEYRSTKVAPEVYSAETDYGVYPHTMVCGPTSRIVAVFYIEGDSEGSTT